MKHTIALIIFFFNVCLVMGQSFDKIATHYFNDNKPINKTDSLNRKQGRWIHYRISFNSWCSALSGQESDTCFRLVSKGEYVNNRKMGEWVYYNDGGCYINEDRREIYDENGSVNRIKEYQVKSNVINRENTFYNKDSAVVTSEIILQDIGTVRIRCINKDSCVASFKEKIILTFSYDLLEIKLDKFCYGLYNRDLRLNQKIFSP